MRHGADADPSRLDRDAPDDLTHNTRDDPDDESGPDEGSGTGSEETGTGGEHAVPTEPPPQ